MCLSMYIFIEPIYQKFVEHFHNSDFSLIYKQNTFSQCNKMLVSSLYYTLLHIHNLKPKKMKKKMVNVMNRSY